MTIGDKIKIYRNFCEMSQEELGQKLLVSKQMISLWENGQTVPTIDNLIHLKEVFGVSGDDIINVENETEEFSESYKFSFSNDEVDEILNFKYQIYTKKRLYVHCF